MEDATWREEIRFSEFFNALRRLDRDPARQDGGHLDENVIRSLVRTVDVDEIGFVHYRELQKIADAFKMGQLKDLVEENVLDVNGEDQIDCEQFITLMTLTFFETF